MNTPHDTQAAACLVLRSCYSGDLLVGDRTARLWFVRDLARARLVASIERWMLDAREATLCLPDAGASSLELLVSLNAFDDQTDPVCDRWRAHHTSTPHRVWGLLEVEAGKLIRAAARGAAPGDEPEMCVIEGAAIFAGASRAPAEAALCRSLNADRARLRLACEALLHAALPGAVCVGIDESGIDLRTTVGPVRLDAWANPRLGFALAGGTRVVPGSGPEMADALLRWAD